MAPTENHGILVIGSGEAGKDLAWMMGGEGHRTAVVEWKLIGGSCPNVARLPSKNKFSLSVEAFRAGRGHTCGRRRDRTPCSLRGPG